MMVIRWLLPFTLPLPLLTVLRLPLVCGNNSLNWNISIFLFSLLQLWVAVEVGWPLTPPVTTVTTVTVSQSLVTGEQTLSHGQESRHSLLDIIPWLGEQTFSPGHYLLDRRADILSWTLSPIQESRHSPRQESSHYLLDKRAAGWRLCAIKCIK